MGCDIHSYVEKKQSDGSWSFVKWPTASGYDDGPWSDRCYANFGFLADVRNYSAVPPIAEAKGFPNDASSHVRDEFHTWDGDGHSHSWLTLAELLAVDYEQTVEDRRVTRQTGPNSWDGGCTGEPGEGKSMKLRDFLTNGFMADLETLKTLGSPDQIRVVFFFDN